MIEIKKKIENFFKKKFRRKKKLLYVEDSKGLNYLSKEIFKNKIFGLDTEFDWRTTYFPEISLIQVSTNKNIFLIDCLKVQPTIALKKYLEDEKYLKIFHSVRSDATVLSKCLDIKTKNVFDIQIAQKLISNDRLILSYGKIVYEMLGLKIEKSETNSNWLRRPLSSNQIYYALEDVDFLIEIYQLQRQKLIEKNLLEKTFTMSEKEADLGNQSLKDLRIEKVKNKLSTRGREIFLWREKLAESENIPPSFIFKNKSLNNLISIKSDDPTAGKKINRILGDNKLTDLFIKNFL
tara:strand:+ start:841 stop:1719 length:879 start_codon:yes stop_codon:yes gene_type:complete